MNKISIIDAASELGVHPNTIRRWVRGGHLPHYRIGRKIWIDKDEIARMFAENRSIGHTYQGR
jgi:excisionase family DNA binding protein